MNLSSNFCPFTALFILKKELSSAKPHNLFYFLESLTFIYIRKLREKLPPKILISLCISLLPLLIVFLAGIEETLNKISCQVVTALLHYIILTIFREMLSIPVNFLILSHHVLLLFCLCALGLLTLHIPSLKSSLKLAQENVNTPK